MLDIKAKYNVRLVDDESGRYYQIDDEPIRLPGVTSILEIVGGNKSNALIGWAKKQVGIAIEEMLLKKLDEEKRVINDIDADTIAAMIKQAKRKPKEILEGAGNYGTRAHEYINQYLLGQEPKEMPSDIENPILGFKSWLKTSGYRVVWPDTKVASKKYQYGGSLDALLEKDGEYYIGDWKTSNAIRETYALQVAGGYAIALSEMFDIKIAGASIVRFGKDRPDFEIATVASMNRCKEGFLAALKLHQVVNKYLYSERITLVDGKLAMEKIK